MIYPMRFDLEPPFRQAARARRVAVLLLNLGTPAAPTPQAVRRYLAQFLSDSRVIEQPRLIWQPLLHTLVLPLRSRASARKYAAVWMPEGSPLRVYTEKQVDELRRLFARHGCEVQVDYAMRYGTPSIAGQLQQFRRAGVERVLCVPMYPQYSASTTATAYDAVFAALKRLRNQPEIRTLHSYADFSGYLMALVTQVQEYWTLHGRPDFAAGDRMLLSFHGLPKRMIDRGDPYYQQCQLTAMRLAQSLSLSEVECRLTFQSRFGLGEWLQPYTLPTLHEFGRAGVRRVDVFCPGFTADCLETLEEIGIEGRDVFLAAGGKSYHRIPCLNAAPAWINGLAELIALNLQGWLGQGSDLSDQESEKDRRAAARN